MSLLLHSRHTRRRRPEQAGSDLCSPLECRHHPVRPRFIRLVRVLVYTRRPSIRGSPRLRCPVQCQLRRYQHRQARYRVAWQPACLSCISFHHGIRARRRRRHLYWRRLRHRRSSRLLLLRPARMDLSAPPHTWPQALKRKLVRWRELSARRRMSENRRRKLSMTWRKTTCSSVWMREQGKGAQSLSRATGKLRASLE